MSFNFGFAGDEYEQELEDGSSIDQKASTNIINTSNTSGVENVTHSLRDLLDNLPERISYSVIPIDTGDRLPRRDLFDARFQILSADEEESKLVGSESDLIPGVYEGGFKTWECSLDLVRYLHQDGVQVVGKRVVELGCGTALPSCRVLYSLLSDTTCKDATTELHLCDFNSTVLNLVTLPNLLLSYYFALHSSSQEELPDRGDVDLGEEFLTSFMSTLSERGISLHFHSGPWHRSLCSEQNKKETLVLTSETTYNVQGIESLLDVLKGLTISSQDGKMDTLVATKDYYFGLGGGLTAFLNAVERDSEGQVEWKEVKTVRQFETGVKRRILGVVSKARQ
ncbi:unnamed protein product [Sympodiomycopsis kandeliae]